MTHIDNLPFLFQKPDSVCVNTTDIEEKWLNSSQDQFIQSYKNKIEKLVTSFGYHLRLADYDDIIPSVHFSKEQYDPTLANEISAYDIYRFITYGHGLIIENKKKEIKGCLFEVGYDTPKKSSFSIRLGIDKECAGKDFGTLITVYSCLLAMERGAKIKEGFIEWNNYVQIYIQLNKVGWIFNNYFGDVKGMVPTFTAILPLTPEGLLKNRIDYTKIPDYVKSHKEGKDYVLIDFDDIISVQNLYEKSDFKISGFIKSGIITKTHKFFALPSSILGLNE